MKTAMVPLKRDNYLDIKEIDAILSQKEKEIKNQSGIQFR